jgi:hypothetical protein
MSFTGYLSGEWPQISKMVLQHAGLVPGTGRELPGRVRS